MCPVKCLGDLASTLLVSLICYYKWTWESCPRTGTAYMLGRCCTGIYEETNIKSFFKGDGNYSSLQNTDISVVWGFFFFFTVGAFMQIRICFPCLFGFGCSKEAININGKVPVNHIINKRLCVTGRLWTIGLNILCFQGFENKGFNRPCKQTWVVPSLPGVWALPKPEGASSALLLVTLAIWMKLVCTSRRVSVPAWIFLGGHLPFLCELSPSYVKSQG